jgi:hypothetical protein
MTGDVVPARPRWAPEPGRHRRELRHELGVGLRGNGGDRRRGAGRHRGARAGGGRAIDRAAHQEGGAERRQYADQARRCQSHATILRSTAALEDMRRPADTYSVPSPPIMGTLWLMMTVRGRARGWAGRILIGFALAAVFPGAAGAATSAALTRYVGAVDHWVTTGAVTSGYHLEATLGFLSPYSSPGTVALYGCLGGGDHFLSLDPGCEGQTELGTQGWIYTAAPATVASEPVYSCLVATPAAEDHFASLDPHCEDQITVGLLGYVLASAPLNRYLGAVHWVTTGSVSSGYGLEATLGFLVAGGSGTSPLYGCAAGADHFLSLDSGCEGQTVLGLEGWIYGSPPADVASVAIYRCRTSSDHFASADPHCEGQTTEALLGYALQAPVPAAPVPPGGPRSIATSVPQPVASAGHHRGRPLHVKITFGWTWRHADTRLSRAQIGHLPRGATIRISCRGRGRACASGAIAARLGGVRHLVRSLVGRVYRAGDRLFITVSARGYQSERAEVRIRYDEIPTVGLL